MSDFDGFFDPHYLASFQILLALGHHVSDEKTIRKLKKLAKRIHTQMESVKDTMEDLEIEFEVLNQLINRLESKGTQPSNSIDVDDEYEEMDLENSSTTSTVNPNTPKKF
jgi:archaellum component FlaC